MRGLHEGCNERGVLTTLLALSSLPLPCCARRPDAAAPTATVVSMVMATPFRVIEGGKRITVRLAHWTPRKLAQAPIGEQAPH